MQLSNMYFSGLINRVGAALQARVLPLPRAAIFLLPLPRAAISLLSLPRAVIFLLPLPRAAIFLLPLHYAAFTYLLLLCQFPAISPLRENTVHLFALFWVTLDFSAPFSSIPTLSLAAGFR